MLRRLIFRVRLQWFKWWPTTGHHVKLTADQVNQMYDVSQMSSYTYQASMVQEFRDFLGEVHHFKEVSIFDGGNVYFLDAIDAINFKLKFM